MNNTFHLFYSPKPRSQVRSLIYRKWSLRHSHIFHNTPCSPPPPPTPKICITFLLSITVVPRETEDKAYAKFGGQTSCIMGDVQLANVCYKKSSNVEIST